VGCAAGIDQPGNADGVQALIFSNLVVAENAARLSPRAYSLLQQAVQEQAVVVCGKRWKLAQPFSLFTTHSPTDDGEAPTVELFDDRFLLRIRVSSPPYHEEFGMATAVTGTPSRELKPVLSCEELQALQQRVPEVSPPPSVVHYAVRLVRATRVHEGENPDFVYEWVERGAGPRGVSALVLAAKAQALLHSRTAVSHDDVRAVVLPALRHRLVTNRNARSNGVTPDRVLQRLLDEIPPRVRGDDRPPRFGESLTFHDWEAVES
jgi:MoxR-like ATPase